MKKIFIALAMVLLSVLLVCFIQIMSEANESPQVLVTTRCAINESLGYNVAEIKSDIVFRDVVRRTAGKALFPKVESADFLEYFTEHLHYVSDAQKEYFKLRRIVLSYNGVMKRSYLGEFPLDVIFVKNENNMLNAIWQDGNFIFAINLDNNEHKGVMLGIAE